MAESEKELKSLLIKVKEESETADLKLNIQKMKIMASIPISSWHPFPSPHGIHSHPFMENRWGNMETVRDFIFLGSKITADGDCSHEIKRCLLLGKKAMTNLDSILKSRDITLLTKVYLVNTIVFPIVMCGCESWTIMKAKH